MKGKKSAAKKIIRLFTLTEMLAVTAIISSVPMGAYVLAKKKAVEIECLNNIRQAGMGITSYHLSNSQYPKAAFYPENPKTGEDSICVVLSEELKSEKIWLCPSMPDKLKEKGLTWVYNDAIAGKAAVQDPEKTWTLIEFTCVSKNAIAPHPGGFNIVHADGNVQASKTLPEDILKNQQAILEKFLKNSKFASAIFKNIENH
jgi:prepilin-type N-terminal cleavage/methylation domain-containing protein/prepilin-type processing-associated H-X9-DG protein